MENVKVRYGPSPTGIPHIGNIRTALFNYLFAKNKGGKFFLRIEDTDQARIVPGAVEKIQESLKSLSLNWDGEIIFQSKRLNLYQKYLKELKSKGLAYEDEGAWRFKISTEKKEISWQDVVHGQITFPTGVLEDFVIIKSDGFPTYHFASVVDDHEMEISHVMRGDEWISSTPKHLQLYNAFGWQTPKFAHLPAILGQNHKKLSKRDGAKSVMEYLDEGYLPQALVNFMVLLGWAPKSNQEIFSLYDLEKEFTLERINKNSPIFNIEKLKWMNGQWIRRLDNPTLSEYTGRIVPTYSIDKISHAMPVVKDRLQTLKDFETLAAPLIDENVSVDPSKVILGSDKLTKFKEAYQNIIQWDKTNISNATTSVMRSEDLSKPEALGSIGTAVSGSKVTPPIFDMLQHLGKAKTIKRLEDVIKEKEK